MINRVTVWFTSSCLIPAELAHNEDLQWKLARWLMRRTLDPIRQAASVVPCTSLWFSVLVVLPGRRSVRGASRTRFIQGIEQLSCTTRDDCKLGGYALRAPQTHGTLC